MINHFNDHGHWKYLSVTTLRAPDVFSDSVACALQKRHADKASTLLCKNVQ